MKFLTFANKMALATLCAGVLFLFALPAQAQNINERGAVVANLNYGTNFTRLYMKIAEIAIDSILQTNIPITYTGTGPITLQCDYMLGKGFSIGGELTHVQNGFSATFSDKDFNTAQEWQQTIHTTLSRQKLAVRLGFHPIKSEKWDWYLAMTGGVRRLKVKVATDVPLLGEFSQKISVDITDLFSNSISPYFRVATGLRYISPMGLGVNAELGVSGPLLSAGISYRFK